MRRAAVGSIAALLLAGLLAACAGEGSGDVVKLIIDDLAGQQFGRATARYRAEEERVLSSSAAPAWRRGLEHEDATVREWSIDALARIGEAEDVARVVTALDDPFRRVQEAAARGLVAMNREAARQAFLERLRGTEAMRQAIAAQGLADLGDPAGAAPLIEQLTSTEVESGVRGVIAQSLAMLGDERAIGPLAEVAGNPANEVRLRRVAVEALASFSGAAAIEALRGLTDSDDEYVRDVARRAIEGRG